MTSLDRGEKGLARLYLPHFPFPPVDGGRWVGAEQARALVALGWRVEIVSWLESPGALAAAARRFVPPELSEALTIRTLRDPHGPALPVAEWAARAAPGEPAGERESRLRRVGRVVRSIASPHASPELYHYPPAADLRAHLPPADLGIYHYSFAHAWLRRRTPPPERRCVVHVHNLESRIAAIRAGSAPSPSRLLHRRNARRLARHERALGTLVDELWFVSRADLRDWSGHAHGAELRFVPPTFPALRGSIPAVAERTADTVLGFVGTLDFEPNLRGVEWLVRELAPVLARMDRPPRIVVAGRGLPDDLRRAGEAWGFFDFRGFVEDLASFWAEISAILVPDLHGIGVRIKLLEALARGVPALTHPIAAEALAPDVAADPLLSSATDPLAWRDRIVALADPRPDTAAPPSLDGRSVYRFVDSLG